MEIHASMVERADLFMTVTTTLITIGLFFKGVFGLL